MKRKISFIAAGFFALTGVFLLLMQGLGMTGHVIGNLGVYDQGILIAEGLFVVAILLFQLGKKK